MGGALSCCLPCAGGGGGGAGPAAPTAPGDKALQRQPLQQPHPQAQQAQQPSPGRPEQQQLLQAAKGAAAGPDRESPVALADLDEYLGDVEEEEDDDEEDAECAAKGEDGAQEGGGQHRLSPRLHDIEEEDDEECRNTRERWVMAFSRLSLCPHPHSPPLLSPSFRPRIDLSFDYRLVEFSLEPALFYFALPGALVFFILSILCSWHFLRAPKDWIGIGQGLGAALWS